MAKDKQQVKSILTEYRVAEQVVRQGAGPLGEETLAVLPEDLELMYIGKMCFLLMQEKVALSNQMVGFLRYYGEIDPTVKEQLEAMKNETMKKFEQTRLELEKKIKKHPLVLRLCGIKGLTPYRLAMMMAMIKDPRRFPTPSKLAVYAGVASKADLKVCKLNLNKIRLATNNPDFGYNTKLQGQLYILAESLLKSKGYFFKMYADMKPRLVGEAIAAGKCRMLTEEEVAEGKGEAGRYYMEGRTKQTVEQWAHSNCLTRIGRTILHLIYAEWMLHLGVTPRNPYVFEYLGHTSRITIEDILAYENL